MQMRYFVRLSPEHSSNLHFLYSIQSLSFVFDFLFLWVEGILKYWSFNKLKRISLNMYLI